METDVNWLSWAILSTVFAGLTAILANIGVKDVDSNAVRTCLHQILLREVGKVLQPAGICHLIQDSGFSGVESSRSRLSRV